MEDIELESLRKMLKLTKERLMLRGEMLAQLIPHIESWADDPTLEGVSYIAFEFLNRYGDHVSKFKEEYEQETRATSNNDLPSTKPGG